LPGKKIFSITPKSERRFQHEKNFLEDHTFLPDRRFFIQLRRAQAALA
jgi:hypothetical protein